MTLDSGLRRNDERQGARTRTLNARDLAKAAKEHTQPRPHPKRRSDGRDVRKARRLGFAGHIGPAAICAPLDHGARLGAIPSYFRDAD